MIENIREAFVTCLRWAPGIVKESSVAAEVQNGEAGAETPPPEVQIRCIIATGGVDRKLRIFAN